MDKLLDDLRQGFPDSVVEGEKLNDYIEQITQETGAVPLEKWHAAADAVLANNAVTLAVERHVGRRERVVAREGETWVHYGKDMRDTRTLIGTGGVFVYNPHAGYILAQRPAVDERAQALRPRDPQLYLDSSYLLYAVGLLSETMPEVALQLFKRYIAPVVQH